MALCKATRTDGEPCQAQVQGEGGLCLRFQAFWECLGPFMDRYEEEEPRWLELTLLELIHGGLYSLRHYIGAAGGPGRVLGEPLGGDSV